MKLPKREEYSVKDLMNDLKKVEPSPSVLSKVGTELIYYEWNCCGQTLGVEHPVTKHLGELLKFAQTDYEEKLVQGELWRAKDTPRAALNDFLRERPEEFMDHILDRPVEYIRGLLQTAASARKDEIKQYKKLEKSIRSEIKEDPENPELWNKLRLVLWIVGKYSESSEAFQTARKLGWSSEESALVAL
jgi:tetratricopeptide (TPR) repeat protein